MDAISILLVDENPTFLRLTTHMLREYFDEEITVVGASPGNDDALDQARRLKPHVVLIGMDQRHTRNLRLIPHLRAQHPEVKTVVLGQLDMHSYEQEAMAAGADAFIAKVSLSSDLMPAIRRVLHAAQGRTMAERPVAMFEQEFAPIF